MATYIDLTQINNDQLETIDVPVESKIIHPPVNIPHDISIHKTYDVKNTIAHRGQPIDRQLFNRYITVYQTLEETLEHMNDFPLNKTKQIKWYIRNFMLKFPLVMGEELFNAFINHLQNGYTSRNQRRHHNNKLLAMIFYHIKKKKLKRLINVCNTPNCTCANCLL